MIDKLGFFSKLFTRKNKNVSSGNNINANNNLNKTGELNNTKAASMQNIWNETETNYTQAQTNSFSVEKNTDTNYEIVALENRFESVPIKAQRNYQQLNLNPDLISENDPNYISDLAQGFEEEALCEA